MAWDFIAVSTYVETTVDGGNITLNAPAGAAQGDLLIACIAYRSNAAFTPNDAAWQLVATQQSSGDTDAIEGIGSGVMYYCIRGASNPGFQFNRTGGNVAQGTVLCYRGGASSNIYDTGNAATLGAIGEPSLAGITTAAANELIIAMISHGDNTLTSAVDAVTNPSTASGATDTTTDPTANTWIERFDRGSNTGADTGLIVADGLKSTAGATGTFSATVATNQSRSVFIVGAFKIAEAQTRLFPMASTGESLTAITAALPVVRALPWAGSGESNTASAILTKVINLPTVAIGESVTAATAALPVVRILPWTSTGESVTPDVLLGFILTFIIAATGESVTAAAALSVLDYIQLQLSDYISASAADPTTARLTAPVGKSSETDFQAGKISDDTNPLPSIDLDTDKYTELEWCLFVSSMGEIGDQYEFRVTDSGTPLNSYIQTPKISAGYTRTFPYQSIGESEVATDTALNVIRNLACSGVGESTTAVSSLLVQCTFGYSVIGESLTFDSILNVVRNIPYNTVGESVTSGSSIFVTRPFIYQSVGESLTSDSILNVLRPCIWNAIGESVTATSTLLNLLTQVVASSGDSVTGTAALSVLRSIILEAIGESLTADANLEVTGQILSFLLSAIGESLSADSVLSLVRAFSQASSGESTTSESILSVLRRNVMASEGESLLSIPVMNLARAFIYASTGESNTSDAAVLAVLRSWLMASVGESITADSLLNVLRPIAWSAVGESLTADASLTVLEGLLRLFILNIIGESLTASSALNVVRPTIFSSVGESGTADNILSVLRILAQSAVGESISADSNMSLVRTFALSPIGESVTATSAMTVLCQFLFGVIGESQVTESTLAVLRRLVLAAIGESLTTSPTLYYQLLGMINNPSLLLATLKKRVVETGLLRHSILKLSNPSVDVQEVVQTLNKINKRRITTLTPIKVIDLVTAKKVIQGD